VLPRKDRREVEREHNRALDGRKLGPQARNDCPRTLRRIGTRFVGLQADDEEGLIGRRDVIDEIEPDHGQDALDTGNRPDDSFDLFHHVLGARDRRAFGKPDGGENGALVLLGEKGLRQPVEQEYRCRGNAGNNDDPDDRNPHEASDDRDIAEPHPFNSTQDIPHGSPCRLAALQ
jgi:hypothetical protein